MRAIRPYQPEDRAAATLVYFRAVREGSAAFYTKRNALPGPLRKARTLIGRQLLDQDRLVAEENGRMTGFFSMDPTGYLDMAFVIPEAMGDGTAAQLYDTLMARARARGLTRFTVRAAEQSRRFLSRRGWTVTGHDRLKEGDQVFDICLMALEDAA